MNPLVNSQLLPHVISYRLVGSPRLELHLMVEEVQFGVSQSVNDKHTRGHFVYCIEIKVSPSEKWAHLCSQTSAKPSETYCLQRHSTLGISERLSKLSLPELNEIPEATANSSNLDVGELDGNLKDSSASATVVKHRWLPATFDPKSSEKSVEWAWKMVTWDDGQPFHEDNPTICSWKSIPELPYKNPEVVRFKDLEDVNEATWDVSTDVVKALNGRLDWTFEIRIYTASVQQMQVRVGEDVVTYRKKAQRVAAKFKGKTSRSNALIIPPPSWTSSIGSEDKLQNDTLTIGMALSLLIFHHAHDLLHSTSLLENYGQWVANIKNVTVQFSWFMNSLIFLSLPHFGLSWNFVDWCFGP